ncbi:hypothetical protein VNO77_27631 [Canavalia gladiata]|uniref:Uncharacterized protein n=1 Tax=Canavalia gladiata TaxID=3824 RepID=A0AAN9Q784_CANGL
MLSYSRQSLHAPMAIALRCNGSSLSGVLKLALLKRRLSRSIKDLRDEYSTTHTSNTIPRLHARRTRSLMFVPECGGCWGLFLKQGQYYMDGVWAESGTPTGPEVAQAWC